MDKNIFDALLREHGWFYDNSWNHNGVSWDCYVDKNYGVSDPFFVILAVKDNGSLLQMTNNAKEEIWSGPLGDQKDVRTLMEFILAQGVRA